MDDMNDKDKKEKGPAIVIGVGPGESSGDKPGASIDKDFLGEHFDGLKEGDTGSITFKYKVVSKDDNGVDLDFEKVESCDAGSDDSDEEDGMNGDWKDDSKDDEMDNAFNEYKEDRKKRGKGMDDMD